MADQKGPRLENWLGFDAVMFAPGTPEKLRRLIAKAPEMASMLRELEWMGGPSSECPMCEASPPRTREVDSKPHPTIPGMVLMGTGRMVTTGGQHAPDCRLATLLRELP